MAKRRRKNTDVEAQVMVANLHRCCICRIPNLHVQLHHIDGDPANPVAGNLAVVCLNDHSKVTGDEGLGRRYTPLEVTEDKRRWESACAAMFAAQAARVHIERSLEAKNAARKNLREDLKPIYSNLELARSEGEVVGVNIEDNLGPYMFDQLIKGLEKMGRLSKTRPETLSEFAPNRLVHETVLATKVLIPHRTLKETVPSVRELAVWVADPGAQTLSLRSNEPYDFAGAFLYLTTPLYDEGQPETLYSGCSALQVISNLIAGKPFFTPDRQEPLGRATYAHPLDKLRSIGGIIVDRRPIETLYKPRYMSDEQCFTDGRRAYRVHDLLAYPLYIGNSYESLVKRGPAGAGRA